MKPIYMGGKTEARIGDIVMFTGNVRGIVIRIDGTFLDVLLIGTSLKTGDTFVLPQRSIEHLPSSQCHLMETLILNLA